MKSSAERTEIARWQTRQQVSTLSQPEMQNELLHLIADHIHLFNLSDLKMAKYYQVILDCNEVFCMKNK